MEEKTAAARRKEELAFKARNGWTRVSDEEADRAMDFCKGYVDFLTAAKTEREAVDYTLDLLEHSGFRAFDPNGSYQPGDRVYCNNRGKALILAVIGRRPVSDGLRIAAAHIDSPRLDLKQHPLYESQELAYFKTH